MNKKRVLIYSIGIFVFVVLITIRQAQIRYARNQPIVSTYSQWQRNGKAVVVKKVLTEDVPLFTKLTLRPIDNVTSEGYVPKAIQEKLSAGQGIYIDPRGDGAIGSVSEVSREIALDTGMFRVQVVFEKSLDFNGWQVVYANTDILHNVICVSDNVVDRENGKPYVWKIEDGHVIRQEIEIGQHNGYGVVIRKGLNEGDIVVCEGFTQLSENDSVNVVSNIDDSGVKQ